jgi:hypothetical protein
LRERLEIGLKNNPFYPHLFYLFISISLFDRLKVGLNINPSYFVTVPNSHIYEMHLFKV